MVGRLYIGGTWGCGGSTVYVYICDEEKEKAKRLCPRMHKHALEILLRGHSMNQGLEQEMEDFLCPFLSPCIHLQDWDRRTEGAMRSANLSHSSKKCILKAQAIAGRFILLSSLNRKDTIQLESWPWSRLVLSGSHHEPPPWGPPHVFWQTDPLLKQLRRLFPRVLKRHPNSYAHFI